MMARDTDRMPPAALDEALVNDWHAVAFSKDLAQETLLPVTLLGEELVLWRDASGVPHIWEDLCLHRGARLSKGWIADDTVVCPYHGWRYGRSGKCVLIPVSPDRPPPPKARALTYQAVERYGMIWASFGKPAHDVPRFPEWEDDSFRKFHAGPYEYKANGFRSVENFLDATHFPFVHAGLNGVPTNPDRIEDYQVFHDADGLSTSPITVYQPYGDHRRVPVHATYVYHCFRPLVAYFSKGVQVADPTSGHRSLPGDRFCTFLAAQPVDPVNCVIRLVVAINFGPELTDEDIRRRQDQVFAQDRAIVETQRPERIPVDLRAELHHRSDKFGVAYRRWLGALGITYGTC